MLGQMLEGVRRKPEVKKGERSCWDCEGREGGQQGRGNGVSWQEEGRGQPQLQSTRGTKQVPATCGPSGYSKERGLNLIMVAN